MLKAVDHLVKISFTAATCFSLIACANNNNSAPIPIVEIPVDSAISVRNEPTTELAQSSSDRVVPVQNSVYEQTTSGSNTVISVPTNRDYSNIVKGSYSAPSYTIKPGDTLYYVAWISGKTVDDIRTLNNLGNNALNVGQTLKTGNAGSSTVIKTTQPNTTTTNTKLVAAPTPQKPIFNQPTIAPKPVAPTAVEQPHPIAQTAKPAPAVKETNTVSSNTGTTRVENITWRWPTNGKLIVNYSAASKGVDISGSTGQAVVAAADGIVMYEGNALPGYGNLIIIKHNADYLTAYAHNNKILVKEKDSVKAGQKIAEMGSTGTTSPRLHFEVRYKANAVDPMRFLPKK